MRNTNWTSPTLFKSNSRGGMQQWRTWSHGDRVHTEFGVIGGKLQTSMNVERGKNPGKANSTTGPEQAAVRARQLYEKQVKRGFLSDAGAAGRTKNALPGVLPMLAHIYQDHREKATWPAFVQPKLDGVRCLAVVRKGKATLYTRSQKVVNTMPHVVSAVEELSEQTIEDFTLDGELYTHSLHDDFGKILGLVKRGSTSDESRLVQYHVYDVVETSGKPVPFSIRRDQLNTIAEKLASVGDVIHVVRTEEVESEDRMMDLLSILEEHGYEGCMYRSRSGPYEHRRSKHLLKVKSFHGDGVTEEDFEVVGLNPGKGKLMGRVGSYRCVTGGKSPVEFRAKVEGSLDLIQTLADGKKMIGKLLTVKYQGKTPDGSLRFPVGVRFRDGVEK